MNSDGSSFSSKIAVYGGGLVTLPLAVDEALKGRALLSIVRVVVVVSAQR